MLIFEMSKNSTNFHAMGIGHFGSSIGMNVSIYVNLRSFFFFFFWVPSLRYSRSSNFTKIKIFHLRHEGSMIQVQCQLVICRGPFYLPKDTF